MSEAFRKARLPNKKRFPNIIPWGYKAMLYLFCTHNQPDFSCPNSGPQTSNPVMLLQ